VTIRIAPGAAIRQDADTDFPKRLVNAYVDRHDVAFLVLLPSPSVELIILLTVGDVNENTRAKTIWPLM
jgi:hypothetical protein